MMSILLFVGGGWAASCITLAFALARVAARADSQMEEISARDLLDKHSAVSLQAPVAQRNVAPVWINA